MQKLSIEAEAAQVASDAARKIRDDFQLAHPHYAPPPWAAVETWGRWVTANVNLHGISGFVDRQLWLQIPKALLKQLHYPISNPQVAL